MENKSDISKAKQHIKDIHGYTNDITLKEWYEYAKDKTIKVVVNNNYGNFGLSDSQCESYKEKINDPVLYDLYEYEVCLSLPYADTIFRTDPRLVAVIDEGLVNKSCSHLVIEEIPMYTMEYFSIVDYDGFECVELLCDKFKLDLIQEFYCNTKTGSFSAEKKMTELNSVMDIVDSI